MVGVFNRSGPEIGYSEIDLKVTFLIHCNTANPKCPALTAAPSFLASSRGQPWGYQYISLMVLSPSGRKKSGGRISV